MSSRLYVVIGGALIIAGFWLVRPPSEIQATRPEMLQQAPPEDPTHLRRTRAIASHAPDLNEREVEEFLERSDAARDALSDRSGLTGLAEEVEVTENMCRRYYDEHRERFGRRSYAQSQVSIERIVRYERMLEVLEQHR